MRIEITPVTWHQEPHHWGKPRSGRWAEHRCDVPEAPAFFTNHNVADMREIYATETCWNSDDNTVCESCKNMLHGFCRRCGRTCGCYV